MKKYIFILIILLLSGCGYDKYEIPEEVSIKELTTTFELFTEHTLDEMISVEGAQLLNGEKSINHDEIGNYKITANLKYQDKDYKYIIKYKIIDTTAPVFISYSSSRTVLINNDIYPCEDIVYADNYDNKPSCMIEGEYDLTKEGSYNVEYVIKDNSNNETRKDLKIKVVKEFSNNSSSSSNSSSTSKKLLISDVIKEYKKPNTMIGIDVSRWQGDIDYEKVKASGVEFVIMRIGVQSSAEGELAMDSFYQKNIKNAKDAGLKVGVYLYSTALNEKTAIEHAKWVVDTLDGVELDFPIAYDWENWKWFMDYEVSLHGLSQTFVAFEKEVKKYGYTAMLYSSKFYLEKIWINYTNAPVWLAHYTSKTSYAGDYIMWQMSCTGKVEGINADVDINIYYKDNKFLS